MVLIRNILKVVVTIIVGCLVGFILGSIFGALLGLFISPFIQDNVLPHQAILISILLSLTLGGLLSWFAARVFNSLFETNINSFLGAIPGALIGLFLVVFVDGYFDISTLNNYYGTGTVQNWAITSIMPYSSTIGRQIGTIIFPLFGAIGIIREIIKSHLELRRNHELMKNLPPSQNWRLPEIPQETHTFIQAKLTARPSPQSPIKLSSTKETFLARLFLFSLKTFAIACIVGILISILGWQVLGWNSSAQFSDGFFLAGAVLAMLGYSNMLGEHRASRNSATRYGETAGEMNMYERMRQWAIGAEDSFALFTYIFFISAYLFGFAILISSIF